MITILGATGNIGSKVSELLISSGKKVRLIARHEEKLKPFAEKGAEIKIGDSSDAEFLTNAFSGSEAVLLMIPGNYQSDDFKSYQDKLGNAQIEAIKKSGIKKVVFISSVGGHTEENTGVVAGLARQEVRLKALDNVDVKILRPTYFMENYFANIPLIKNMSIAGSNIKGDVNFPMIATQDIAKVAAEYLSKPDFSGKSVRALLGPKDYSFNEVTSIIAKAIGKDNLNYVQFSSEDAIKGMVSMGMSSSVASGMIELGEGINKGVFDLEKRNPETTTPTTFEEFAQIFAYAYNS